MSNQDTPRIYARVFVDRIAWFLATPAGELIGRGVVDNFTELRGVQVRAGITEVILAGRVSGSIHGEWRKATREERAQLEIFFARPGSVFPDPVSASALRHAEKI